LRTFILENAHIIQAIRPSTCIQRPVSKVKSGGLDYCYTMN